ncbi:MAG: hypothetical protein OXJ55_19090 [Caldilineaceae bacterium]|nr:hypothetical protein [Caldilineaceae bacterium]
MRLNVNTPNADSPKVSIGQRPEVPSANRIAGSEHHLTLFT